MSEPEKSHNTGAEEEQNEEVIQEGVEARGEQEQEVMGTEATRSATEEQQETVTRESPETKTAKVEKGY